MSKTEQQLTEKESLALIARMISRAKDSYHATGIGAIMWGIVIAICALVKLSEIQFDYRLPFDIYLLTLIAIVPQVFISIRERKEQRVKSYDDTYMDYIWLGFGICIFILVYIMNMVYAGFAPMSVNYKELGGKLPFRFSEYVSSFFLMLYGLPTFITGAARKFGPMFWGGLICWACAIAALYTEIRMDLLLIALSAIVAWLVPGILMEREYRVYKKEQLRMDV